ncbi:MAG: porphobilinogen synthase [Pontiellaceae bacterium]
MFPEIRLRRLRQNKHIRDMLDIPIPGPEKMIWPAFVVPGKNIREPIDSMPGQYRMSADELVRDLDKITKSGINGVLLFGQTDPKNKNENGTASFEENGIVQESIKQIKDIYPNLLVAADVCVCAYTDHGHCGILDSKNSVDNDLTLNNLSKQSVSLAQAGADIIAPSSMMDGQVITIREVLDLNKFHNTIIMSYSTKFASSMYNPFRDAENSEPSSGDRKSYQASYADLNSALRESEFDEDEGADILMVKPSLFYLDILSKIKNETLLPVAAYNVSGEYSMLHATAERNWGNLKEMVRESTIATVRAGADILITYWANQYEEIFRD